MSHGPLPAVPGARRGSPWRWFRLRGRPGPALRRSAGPDTRRRECQLEREAWLRGGTRRLLGPGRTGRSVGKFGQVRACEAGRAGGACGLLCGCVWLRLKAVTQTGANRIPLTVGSVCLASQRLGDISVRRQLSPPPTLGFAAAAAYAHYTETLVPALPGCAVYGNARTVHKPAGGAADA